MIRDFIQRSPLLDETNFVAENAAVIGDVHLGRDASVWFSATVRGDVHRIRIGARSNVQDNAVVHVTNRTAPTTIGDNVTVGHSAIVHGCTIQDRVLVGMGAIILDHADIGSDTIIGAGALITGGKKIPPRSLVIGSPAKVVRELTDEEVASIMDYANNYVRYKNVYLGVDTPDVNPFYS
jgi:carbonic anhydrase/acetyltransferase-like protein (isoleucine patch superfamily)